MCKLDNFIVTALLKQPIRQAFMYQRTNQLINQPKVKLKATAKDISSNMQTNPRR